MRGREGGRWFLATVLLTNLKFDIVFSFWHFTLNCLGVFFYLSQLHLLNFREEQQILKIYTNVSGSYKTCMTNNSKWLVQVLTCVKGFTVTNVEFMNFKWMNSWHTLNFFTTINYRFISLIMWNIYCDNDIWTYCAAEIRRNICHISVYNLRLCGQWTKLKMGCSSSFVYSGLFGAWKESNCQFFETRGAFSSTFDILCFWVFKLFWQTETWGVYIWNMSCFTFIK